MITIRNEQEADRYLVEEITRDAFWNLYIPGCFEHQLVHHMREHKDFIPELCFVIEYDGVVVGSIFYTHSTVIAADGEETRIITFGPVSISPQLQGKGLGRALIEHSIEEAKKQGYRAIAITGDPAHYRLYGFEGAKKYGIAMPDGKHYLSFMMLPLYEGALDGVQGTIQFSDCLEPDEATLEEFDAQFPRKEKAVQDSQREFEEKAFALDTNSYA